jgi:protein TonB
MAVLMPTFLLGLARHGNGGFDATTVILIVLAAVAGYFVYDFIREAKGRSGVAIVGAIIGHVLLVLFLSLDLAGRLGCNVSASEPELIEFEIAEIEQPKPEEPEPEEPEPEEPEPEPEVKPQEPPPQPKPKKAQEPPPPQQPVNPEPAPAKRWDLSSTGTGNVIVPQGTGGEYGGSGKPDSKGPGKSKPTGDPAGDEKGEAPWQPRSELYIKSMPDPVKVPKIDCPATAQLGVQGDVILKVQIARDGKIRSVKLVKGIGHGCDEVAIKALEQARFKPAIGTNGQAVDFELRYEYAFTVND